MAKTKKKAVLTIEERLEQALVPEAEQPYPVPENWCWMKFESTTQILNGFAFKSQNYVNSGIRIIRISNVQDGFIEDDKPVFYSNKNLKELQSYLLYNEDLLLSLTGNVGRVAILNGSMLPAALNQRVACLRINNEQLLNKRYLFFYLLRKEFVSDCIKSSKGSAQLNMRTEWLKKYAVPISPSSEQQRIVDRIEGLFAKLDEAKEKAQAALDSFETRKAAILHKAFTGELTAKWREENGASMKSWKYKKFTNCIDRMQNGLSKRNGKEGNNFVVLRLANLSDSDFITNDIRYIKLDKKEQQLYKLHINDVIMIRVNGSKENVGKQILVSSENDWAFCDHLIRITYNENIVLPQYMVYFAKSDTYRQYIRNNMVSSAGQNTISRKGMAKLEVPLPDVSEQAEIVRLLDNFFAKEQKAKELCSVLDKIDLIKKSILARAFRGELGTNDPTEESALELLKSIV